MNTATLAHTHDPSTAHDAAANLSRTTSQRVMEVVVDLIDTHGPLTPTELETIYHELEHVPAQKPRSVAKRVSDMKLRVGVLYGTKTRRDGCEALGLTSNRQACIDRIGAYWK